MHLRRLAAATLVAMLAAVSGATPGRAAVFVVDDAGDAADANPGDGVCLTAGGGCTLRAAIDEANASPNGTEPDAVHFAIPGDGPHVIVPATLLPAITEAVVVDGYTQPGAAPNTDTVGTNAVLLVELDGAAAGPGHGLDVLADDVTIRGLVVRGWARIGPGDGGRGIRLAGNRGIVEGCFLGTDASGLVAVANDEAGVRVNGDDATIGGLLPEERNLIAGNVVAGVDVRGARAVVLGNLIGLDASGDVRLQNGRGVRIDGPDALVGTTGGLANVIAGNGSFGVQILARGARTRVLANRIGTDATGVFDRGNGSDGILVENAPDVVLGEVGAGNLVSGNGRTGIQISGGTNVRIAGNLVGTDVTGVADVGNAADGLRIATTGALIERNTVAFNDQRGIALPVATTSGVRITQNRVFSNTGLGIDLESNNVTANDPGDLDTGANGRQNFPVLAAATSAGASTSVSGALDSLPGRTYRIEIFANAACDTSQHGEGEHFLGHVDVTTNGAGAADFATVVGSPVSGGAQVTATATDPDGNTSEFSQCVSASGPAVTTTTSTTTSTLIGASTTTTTPAGGSTTTLPIPCTTAAECGDGDACTVDECPDGFCAWTSLTMIPGVVCHVTNIRGMLEEMVCNGCSCSFERRLRKLERRYDRAERAAKLRGCKRGVGGGRRHARRHERKVNRLVRRGCLVAAPTTSKLVAASSDLTTAAETLIPNAACAR